MAEDNYSTTLYSIPFTNFSVTSTGGNTYYDLWSIKSSSLSRVEIHEINIGQLSTSVTGNQQLTVQLFRGSTALGGGATVASQNLKGWPTVPTALSSATAPSSNLASTTSAALIYCDNTDFSGSFFYRPDEYEEFVLDKSQTFNVRVSAPPVTVQLSGTLLYKEIALP